MIRDRNQSTMRKEPGRVQVFMQAKSDVQINKLALEVMEFARDSILVHMRFLNVAMLALAFCPRPGSGRIATDGGKLYYDPRMLLTHCKEEEGYALRVCLHVLLHLIFAHSFQYEKLERRDWDLAADLAVENTILKLALPGSRLRTDEALAGKLRFLEEEAGALTAEKLYRYFRSHSLTGEERGILAGLCYKDDHSLWQQREQLEITREQWKQLTERVRADLQSFSGGKTEAECLSLNLNGAVRERYSYEKLLHKFMVINEDLRINDEEFDAVYYTYGLTYYGNMPLVEPLEYRDSRKIREFVIAIDTSASCRGPVVENFLRKTYGILTGEDTFFRKMNVHLLQCDSQVRKDTKITSKEELEFFLTHEKLTGFGSTDFRPVFAHIEELLQKREFENLKGMIYFTDGYGIYPDRMPPYEVMFAFLSADDARPEVPPWAASVLLDEEEWEE